MKNIYLYVLEIFIEAGLQNRTLITYLIDTR